MTSRMSWHHSAMIARQASFLSVRDMERGSAFQLNGKVIAFGTVMIDLMSVCQSVACAPLHTVSCSSVREMVKIFAFRS